MPAPDPLRAIFDVVVPRAVDSIDLNEVLAEIDFDEVLARVDLDAVLARVDVDAMLRRIDMDALLERIDIDGLVERINVYDIVRRAQVDAIVRATAGGLGNRLLDLVRRQLVGMDIVLTRIVDRLIHRGVEEPVAEDGTFTGQLAGGASRLAGFLIDLALETGIYTAALATVFFLASFFTGHTIKPTRGASIWNIVAFVVVAALYQWVGLAIAGRTPGRAIAGLRVTAPDRSPMGFATTTRRVLVYPFSFILGLGLIGIAVTHRHRALHDIAAPSLVYYDWGDRPAAMSGPITRYLERRAVETQQDVATANGS